MQLKVVWSLLLKTGSEGPNPHLLCSYAQIGHFALIALVAHYQIEINGLYCMLRVTITIRYIESAVF